MTEPSGNFESWMKSLALTIVGVALALYLAVHLIESIAGPLVVIGLVAVVAGIVVAVIQARRSRW